MDKQKKKKWDAHMMITMDSELFLNAMFHAPMGRFQLESKIGITFISRFHRRPIQLVVFVPVGLSSIC